MTRSFFARHPSVLIFIGALALFTLLVTVLSDAYGVSFLSTSFIKTLGKTLCLCLVAVAMDLIWGYAGILSLGHMAFFALGGYLIGMWLMYARTEGIVLRSLAGQGLPPTPEEVQTGVASQIFGVVGASDLPAIWMFAYSLPIQMALVVVVPGMLALAFAPLNRPFAVVAARLAKVHAALPPGGRLLIAEPMAGTPGAEAMGDAYFGLYLWAMGSGRPRTAAAYCDMVSRAGFARVREVATGLPMVTRLLIADR